jgi:hypothetical protein
MAACGHPFTRPIPIMKFYQSILIRTAAYLFCCGLASTSAATLQFTITNLAPAGSISFLPGFLPISTQEITNVILLTVDGGVPDVLPRLAFISGLGGAGAVFPFTGGGAVFPELLPGDTLSFSLENVDLAAESILYQGSVLFGQVPLTDGGGNFTGADFTLTAGEIAEFDSSGAIPFLILPDSGAPGPESITPTTELLRITVIPEPSVTFLGAAGLVLFMRRRRSA